MLKHTFVSAVADGVDATKVRASNWNAEHTWAGGSNSGQLTRDTAAADGASWVAPMAQNVKFHGAIGDGVTDDTTAFATAITAAAAGGMVFIPVGTYKITSTLSISVNRLTILGLGIESTISWAPSANNDYLFEDSGSTDNCLFKDFAVTARGSATGKGGFAITSSASRYQWDGIYFDALQSECIKHTSAQYDVIRNCRFLNTSNSSSTGIAITCTTFANRLTIRNCRFASNDSSIVLLTSSKGVLIDGNSFETDGSLAGSPTSALRFTGGAGISIIGNYFEATYTGGATGSVCFFTSACKGITVAGNFFAGDTAGTTRSHYFLWFADNTRGVAIIGNRFSEILTDFVRLPTEYVFSWGNSYADASLEVEPETVESPLPVESGGTGIETLTANRIPYGNGTSALQSAANFTFDATTFTTAGQIAFPATQAASSGANTLDDYEENTWTPVLGGSGGTSGQTYTTQVGTYVKIGQLVVAQFAITLSAKGTITGNCEIQGFPFTSNGTGFTWTDIYWETLATSWVKIGIRMLTSAVIASVLGTTAAGGSSATALTTADINNTTQMVGTLVYRATA